MTIIGRHAYFQLFAFDPRVRVTYCNKKNDVSLLVCESID